VEIEVDEVLGELLVEWIARRLFLEFVDPFHHRLLTIVVIRRGLYLHVCCESCPATDIWNGGHPSRLTLSPVINGSLPKTTLAFGGQEDVG
jgi:hypothetical protein